MSLAERIVNALDSANFHSFSESEKEETVRNIEWALKTHDTRYLQMALEELEEVDETELANELKERMR